LPTRSNRALLLRIGALGGVFLVAPFWTWHGPGLCLFHRLTGLECPGCGMTRAFHAISHGQFAHAVDFNIFSPLVYALFLGILLWDVAYLLTGRRFSVPAPLRLEGASGYLALSAVVGYGVLRNLTPLA
jgi:hypothetical protein